MLNLSPEDRAILNYERANPIRTREKFLEVNRRFGLPWPMFLGRIEILMQNGAGVEYADIDERLKATPSSEIYEAEDRPHLRIV